MEEKDIKQAPNDQDAEKSVLCAVMISEDALAEMSHRLDAADFYSVGHQYIFEAACELFQRNVQVDGITLADQLERMDKLEAIGGRDYLYLLADYTVSAAKASHHAGIVRNKAILRRLIQITTEVAQRAYEAREESQDLLDDAERSIFEIARKGEVSEPKTMGELLSTTFERIDKLKSQEGGTTGVPTGFVDLDDLTAGLQPGELIIVAARPSMGKTTFAMNLMERASVQGYPCAFFSCEMTSQQVVLNLLCCRAQVDAHKLRRGFITQEEYSRLQEKGAELYDQRLLIDDTSNLSVSALRAKARRLKQRHGIKIVLIDYLQLMSVGGRIESRQQEISVISRSLKALAKELEVPVVALSQLNRGVESRESHRPRMSDLRESGAIEQDADVIAMLHREDYYKETEENRGLAELIVAKQRNGPTGTIKLRFIRQFMRFESYTGRSEPMS
jgi:replicative DNA helicase